VKYLPRRTFYLISHWDVAIMTDARDRASCNHQKRNAFLRHRRVTSSIQHTFQNKRVPHMLNFTCGRLQPLRKKCTKFWQENDVGVGALVGRSWLQRCHTNRKFACSISDRPIDNFYWLNSSGCVMVLGSTPLLTNMSTTNILLR